MVGNDGRALVAVVSLAAEPALQAVVAGDIVDVQTVSEGVAVVDGVALRLCGASWKEAVVVVLVDVHMCLYMEI